MNKYEEDVSTIKLEKIKKPKKRDGLIGNKKKKARKRIKNNRKNKQFPSKKRSSI